MKRPSTFSARQVLAASRARRRPKPPSGPVKGVPCVVTGVDPKTNTFTVEIIRATPGVCRKCGCTDTRACVVGAMEPCHWVDTTHTLCSGCSPKNERKAA